MSPEEVRELLPLYALGALTPEERARVEEALKRYPELWPEAKALLETAAELAAGLLYTEGLLQDPKEVLAIAPCADGSLPPEAREGVIQVFLRHPLPPPPRRHLALTAACGACGREALPDPGRLGLSPPPPLAVDPDLLLALPERLGEAQRLFRATGGLHAAALFDREGRLVARHLGELSEALLLGYLRVLR